MSQDNSTDNQSAYPDVVLDDHEYDGIKEYDNPMPGWWLWLFYGTVVWSVFYIAALGAGWIDDYDAQLEDSQREIEQMRVAAARDSVSVDAEYLDGLTGDEEALQTGEEIFSSTCAACHGPDGGGGVGPSFKDDEWIHGSSMTDQFEVVRDGVPDQGMPAHEGQFSPEEIASVVAYINSMNE